MKSWVKQTALMELQTTSKSKYIDTSYVFFSNEDYGVSIRKYIAKLMRKSWNNPDVQDLFIMLVHEASRAWIDYYCPNMQRRFAWIYQIARNLVKKNFEHHLNFSENGLVHRKRLMSCSVYNEQQEVINSSVDLPEQHYLTFELTEIRNLVKAAYAKKHTQHKRSLVEKHAMFDMKMGGASYAEISKKFNISQWNAAQIFNKYQDVAKDLGII
jgi:DNA-directed RNA polymerase specialized sigma24 family protein